MTEFNRKMIETLVRQVVTEQLMPTKQVDLAVLHRSSYQRSLFLKKIVWIQGTPMILFIQRICSHSKRVLV